MPGTSSYTKRTLEFCRRCGWRVGPVDRRSPPAPGQERGRTHDYLGIGDMLALDARPGSLLIQSTSLGQVTAHRLKYEADPDATAAIADWLAHGNRFVIWGWWRRDTAVDRTPWTFRELAYGTRDGLPFIHIDIKDARPAVLAMAQRLARRSI